MNKFGRRFSEKYKQQVREIYREQGLEKAYRFVLDMFPGTQKRTIKSWVDKEFGTRVQEIRKRAASRDKANNPAEVADRAKRSTASARLKRSKSEEFRRRRTGYSASWARNNRERVRELDRKYWHEGDRKQKRYAYVKKRKKEDLEFHLRENLRSRLFGLLRKSLISKGDMGRTHELIGCSLEELGQHLRSLYKPEMTDENYGEWHVDHIRPCASFELGNEEQLRECFHYTNLQPLWAEENRAKGDKLPESLAPTLV